MTHLNRTRELIRMAGFFAGVVIMLIYDPPRLEGHPSYLLANIVWAVCAGVIGVIVAEIARRFIPGEARVDAEEELSLTDAEIAKLMFRRRLARYGALALGFAFPLLMFPWPESPDLIVVVVMMCTFSAFVFWFIAEVFVAANPRQLALTRLLRKKAG